MADIQHIYKGSGAPSTTPPDVGLHYVDITNDIQYVSVGADDANDWVKLGAGSGGINEYFMQWDKGPSTPNITVIPADADIIHIEITNIKAYVTSKEIHLPLIANRDVNRPTIYVHVYGIYEGDSGEDGNSIENNFSVHLVPPDEFDTSSNSSVTLGLKACYVAVFTADIANNQWGSQEYISVGNTSVTGTGGGD